MLTEENVSRAAPTKWRAVCKPCRNKDVARYQKENAVQRRLYVNKHLRLIGKVKQYPCLTCTTLCYKKYAKAFCSDKCRFMWYVKITDTCWLWTGAKNRSGYGHLCFGDEKSTFAHRVSYKLFKGPITDNLFVCHSCDNTSCVNPDHLWLGTTQDNKKDQISKGRGGIILKPRDVLLIRKLYDKTVGSATIARIFNVSCSTITNIAKRRIWKHI